ncbi:DUF6569 family protein [Dactylosporangium sp. NPDC005555]|uniref:ARPP-1 family domain-containing protein n=1 Tax=Dactylosporangium sp. NPDC005555 TaxID=3154889 RepID=UPI0033A0C01F
MNLPVPAGVDATGYTLGPPQRAGALSMVPVFGPSYPGIAPPRSGLKLSRVVTYGQVELTNPAASGVAIVPLHVGYIQDSAQNHALCRSAFIAAGQTLRFDDACCVQESQGGYLSERDQWFFVLPVELRPAALRLRGTSQYSKLWGDIARFNGSHGLPARGHLEQVLTRKRAVLTQYQSRLELLDGQVGALFFVGGELAGVEIAPDPVYFAEVWTALVCFAYGPAAWSHALSTSEPAAEPCAAGSLDEVRTGLRRRRQSVADEVGAWLERASWRPDSLVEEDRYLGLRLSTVDGPAVGGQVVTDGSRLVYASLFAAAA